MGNRFRVMRDIALLLVGIAGVINEGFVRSGEPRWGMLMVYMGMMGFPVMLQSDTRQERSEPAPQGVKPKRSGQRRFQQDDENMRFAI